MDENWQQIPGYEGLYEVSDLGNVRSLHRGKTRILSPRLHPEGYVAVCLSGADGKKQYTIHRLVMMAFIGARSDGMVINHINEDKRDNRLANLEYITPAANAQHSISHFTRGEAHHLSKLTETDVRKIREMYTGGMKICQIAAALSQPYMRVYFVAKGQVWKHINPETAQ